MARQTDDLMTSAATKTDYILWLVNERLFMPDEIYKKYSSLIETLTSIEFVWIHPRDEYRAMEGLSMRETFSYETDKFLDKSSGLTAKCTVFEMMVALSRKIERQLMMDVNKGDQSYRWFVEMFTNLGLADCTNANWKPDFENYIRESCKKFMYRDYKSNGVGGMFPLKSKSDIKNEEIWVQCNAYLNEFYPVKLDSSL